MGLQAFKALSQTVFQKIDPELQKHIPLNTLINEPIQSAPKVGRNDPCPCGSGKKYKRCHGAGE